MQLVFLALAALAYRGLLTFGSEADLSRELEEWFFVPTETSPLVVVLLAAWLVYRRRERLERVRAQASLPLALPLLAVGTAIFGWSLLTTAPHLLALSLQFTGLGLAALLFGRAGVRVALLPSLLLVFAVPMPAPLLSEIVYHFQLWTAEYAGWLLFLLGRSAYVSGDQILLATGHFAVIEGCSGLRSVQTLTMVAVLMVDLFGRRGRHALTILLLAPPVAFALNGFRVLALILNPHSEVVAIHNLQGVAILLVGLLILYLVDGLFERFVGARGVDPTDPAPAPSGEHAAARWPVAAGAAQLALLLALSFLVPAWPAPQAAGQVEPIDLPQEIDGWVGEDAGSGSSFLGTIGYRNRIARRYVGNDAPVGLLVLVGDLEQRYRSPISPKTVPPGSGWIVEESDWQGEPGWYVMRSGNHRALVHHWYEGTEGLTDEVVRALLSLDSSPWHRDEDVLAVRLSTDVVGVTRGALERARSRLERFESAIEPELTHLRTKLSRKKVS